MFNELIAGYILNLKNNYAECRATGFTKNRTGYSVSYEYKEVNANNETIESIQKGSMQIDVVELFEYFINNFSTYVGNAIERGA